MYFATRFEKVFSRVRVYSYFAKIRNLLKISEIAKISKILYSIDKINCQQNKNINIIREGIPLYIGTTGTLTILHTCCTGIHMIHSTDCTIN